MAEVQDRWLSKALTADEWSFELRVRYPPVSLKELCSQDKVTFHYYYDQVFLLHIHTYIFSFLLYPVILNCIFNLS